MSRQAPNLIRDSAERSRWSTLAALAVREARRKHFTSHQRWALRSLVLLVLRMISGAAIVAQMNTDNFYRFNAWASWLVPLVAFEVWKRPA